MTSVLESARLMQPRKTSSVQWDVSTNEDTFKIYEQVANKETIGQARLYLVWVSGGGKHVGMLSENR